MRSRVSVNWVGVDAPFACLYMTAPVQLQTVMTGGPSLLKFFEIKFESYLLPVVIVADLRLLKLRMCD